MYSMIELYTIQLARWRLAKAHDIQLIDTTAKSGEKAGYGFLAPSWDIVMGIKQGEITEEEYTHVYLRMLAQSRQRYPEKWATLLSLTKVAFACYCSSNKFCHRHLLYEDFQSYVKACGVEFRLGGEITMGPGERQHVTKGRAVTHEANQEQFHQRDSTPVGGDTEAAQHTEPPE